MVKNKLLMFAWFMFTTLVLAGFASAACITTPTYNLVYLNDTDNFYSAYSGNDVIHVVANITNVSVLGTNFANFSNLTSGCGISGIVNMVDMGDGTWTASCNVSNNATVSNFNGGPITLVAAECLGLPAIDTNTSAILYNMTTPPQPPVESCQRFGNLTTNLVKELNFSSVNFIIQMEMNGTCIHGPNGGSSPWDGYEQIMMLNFNSLNMSSQTIGTSLAGLKDALQINITAPHQFGTTRIYVNENAFIELNTNATITLNNLPFASLPTIAPDNITRPAMTPVVFTAETPWNITYPGGNILIPNGNLTFRVGGFSGYNATDDVAPRVTIVSPQNGGYGGASTMAVNAVVNGTGTEPSYVEVRDNGVVIKNFTSGGANSANCTNITANQETLRCYFYATLTPGTNNFSVYALDFGGTTGNPVTNDSLYTLQNNLPSIQFVASSEGSSSTTYYNRSWTFINVTASNNSVFALANITVVIYNSTGPVNSTMTGSSPASVTFTNLRDGTYYVNATANNSNGDVNASETRTIVIDTTAPTVSASASAGSSDATVTYTSSESTNVNVSYGTVATSLGSSANLSAYVISASVTLSSLGASQLYHYNVTVCDQAGNCVTNGTLNFTTSAATTTTTNPNADSTYASSFWIMTYTADSESFGGAGFNKLLSKYERIKVLLSGEAHFVGVTNVSSNSVTINVSSDPQSATLNVGETKKFEINEDGYYDISVKLNDMENSKANLTVMYLHEKMAETTNNLTAGNNPAAGNGTNPPTTLTTNQTGTQGASGASAAVSSLKNNWVWIVVGILVVLIALGVIFRKRIWFWLSNLKHEHK